MLYTTHHLWNGPTANEGNDKFEYRVVLYKFLSLLIIHIPSKFCFQAYLKCLEGSSASNVESPKNWSSEAVQPKWSCPTHCPTAEFYSAWLLQNRVLKKKRKFCAIFAFMLFNITGKGKFVMPRFLKQFSQNSTSFMGDKSSEDTESRIRKEPWSLSGKSRSFSASILRIFPKYQLKGVISRHSCLNLFLPKTFDGFLFCDIICGDISWKQTWAKF